MDDFPDLYLLWDYNAPEETAVRFYDLLSAVAASENRAYHVELLTQIARTHGLPRQFDEAHKLLDEAEAILTVEMMLPKIRYLLERGRSFNSADEKERALRSLNRVEEALAIQEALLAEYAEIEQPAALTNEEVGECLLALGQAEEARPYFAQAYMLLSDVGWLAASEPERLARLQKLGDDG